jgi:serine/threonine protein kinase
MGALYLAITGDRGLERLLVIKTVLPHLADDEYLARFRDEAKVVVQLNHQNLVPVYDAGQVDGELFIAMEFLEGKDLRAIWNRCAEKAVAFPVDVAAFVVKELCRGLGYAHSFAGLELVHRDVSPPNVLVSYAGEVKLTDFGLAASTLKLEKTAPGIVYGKVSYMSPEQARGEPLDCRSDLYAAGIILWELLTGRQLFPAGSDQGKDLLDRSQSPKIVAPSERAPRVPAELDAICMKALSSEPGKRYGSGEAFREALATWLAKKYPTTDAARVERFLEKLFGEDIVAERAHRVEMIRKTRERVATLPPTDELRKLFDAIAQNGGLVDEIDRRSDDEGPNLGRRGADRGSPSERRRRGGRRVVDKFAEGVGTMLGIQPSPRSPGVPGGARQVPTTSGPATSAAVAAEAEEILLDTPKTEPAPMVGEVLDGRYRIDELIGEGGMGRVFLAEHVEIGRQVAVKILHPVYSHMPDLVERFRREARAASRIGHPNIVDVTDSGTTEDGSTYFVMEYLEGVELASVIDREGALEVGRALSIATQICRAVAAAHAAEIIHRDLKPENVFLTDRQSKSDFVKILDFGIAKSGGAEQTRERRLTSPGVAMGTPEYMAPEQAAGKPADERCDIYAVGAILYEMLGGVPPYDGENFMEILSKKATADPAPLSGLREELPREVVMLVELAMAREPDDRPPSMEAFEYELTKLTSGRGAAVARVLGINTDVTAPASASNPPSFGSNPSVGSNPAVDSGAISAPSARATAAPIEAAAAEPSAFDDDAEPAAIPAPPRGGLLGAASWAAGLTFLALSIGALVYVVVQEPGADAQVSPPPAATRVKPAVTRPAQPAHAVGPVDAGAATRPAVKRDRDPEPGRDPKRDDREVDDKPKGERPSPVDRGDKAAARSGPDGVKKLLADARADVAAQQFAAARAKYRQAIAAGQRSRGNLGLANIAFQQKQFDLAITHTHRAGDSAASLLLRGNAYYRKGDCAHAVTAYQQLLKKDPASKAAKKGIERCRR